MEDLTGKQLGKYQIISPLGQGGMAAVYKAYQPGTERNVALKILPRHYAGEPEFLDRFKQEAKIIAKFQHPHILPVFDYGEDDGYTYLVMPYIKSGTLSDLMVGQPLALWRIRDIISQVGDALDYAHAYGVVHRDIKPSNILIDERDNCLLTDFGIAKIVGGTAQLTSIGHTIGTPAYMSPEQIDPGRFQGEELDGRSDIYSLGIVFYELATGRTPYRAETPPALFVKHLYDPLPPPTKINPDLPEAVGNVILKSLAKDREDRYQTAGDIVLAVQEAIEVDPAEVMRARARESDKTAAVVDPLALALGSAKPEAIPAESPIESRRWFTHRPLLIAGATFIVITAIMVVFLVRVILSDNSQANNEGTREAVAIVTETVGETNVETTESAAEIPAAQPTAKTEAIDPMPTSVVEDLQEVDAAGEILFEDDFESGFAQNWQNISEGFDVILDETGHYVLRADGAQWGGANVGDTSWQDYALEFKVKILATSLELDGSAEVGPVVRDYYVPPNCGGYTIQIRATPARGAQIAYEAHPDSNCEYTILDKANTVSLELDRWYSIRIEAAGPEITTYLDGQPILHAVGSELLLTGGIGLVDVPGVIKYFDDVRVVTLPAESLASPPGDSPPDEEVSEVDETGDAPKAGILFEDDFESGSAGEWNYLGAGFTVVEDETGNYVLQLDLSGAEDAEIGNSSWRDYALEFRVKILESSDSGDIWVHPRHNQAYTICTPYTLFFKVGEEQDSRIERGTSTEGGCESTLLDTEEDLNLETDRWYSFRIEVVGPEIAVFLDGQPVLHAEDSEHPLNGPIRFSKSADGLVYYDDIRVIHLPYNKEGATSFVEGDVLFEDDFESGFAQNWHDITEGFDVILDETGNYVLRADGAQWGGADVGDTSWQDYTLEFKVKILATSLDLDPDGVAEVGPVVRNFYVPPNCSGYGIIIRATPARGAQITYEARPDSNCKYTILDKVNTVSLELDRWYSIRIEAAGPDITTYLEGQPILHAMGSELLLTGGIGLVNVPSVIKYFDDVRVTELLPVTPDTNLELAIESARADPDGASAVSALETAAGRTTTYQDDFSDSLDSRFMAVGEGDSSGRFTDGAYLLQVDLEAIAYLSTGHDVSPHHADVVLQFDIRLDPSLSGQGRIFLRSSETGQYEFVFYYKDRELHSQISYNIRGLSNDLAPFNHGHDDGAWHNVVAVVVDYQVSYFWDGGLVFTDTYDVSPGGSFSIDAMPGTAMWMDNFRIWEIDT
ncbi:MAG: protein kinase [Candidatus Promineifilaceae bacterium]